MLAEIDPATVPPKMTRIERLMADLQGPGCDAEPYTCAVIGEARLLILDLLGMTDLPLGERLYAAACKRNDQEIEPEDRPTGSAEELAQALRFSDRWLADIWPANEAGQVPFARATHEFLAEAVRRHLKKEHPTCS